MLRIGVATHIQFANRAPLADSEIPTAERCPPLHRPALCQWFSLTVGGRFVFGAFGIARAVTMKPYRGPSDAAVRRPGSPLTATVLLLANRSSRRMLVRHPRRTFAYESRRRG